MYTPRVCALMAAATGLLAVIVVPRLLLPNRFHAAPASGSLTRSQALRRADPLCRALCNSPDARLYLDAVPGRVYSHGGLIAVWIVQAYYRPRQYAAYLTLDATTGQVTAASRPPPSPLWGRSRFLSSKEAVRCAHTWIGKMGLDAGKTGWRVVSSPTRRVNGWRVDLVNLEREAHVIIDGFSGDLLYFRCHQLNKEQQARITLR